MTFDPSNEDAFLERVAKPLRQAERPDATFEARAMSAVHAAARADAAAMARRSWWLRPRTVRMTPLASLAVAAGLAAVVLVGAQMLANGRRVSAPLVASRPDTVHLVRFVLIDQSARQVALVGDFNQWKRGVTLLASNNGGVWTVDVPLQPGRHEYAFVVLGAEGERWLADPLGLTVRDEFGTESSVISVGMASSS